MADQDREGHRNPWGWKNLRSVRALEEMPVNIMQTCNHRESGSVPELGAVELHFYFRNLDFLFLCFSLQISWSEPVSQDIPVKTRLLLTDEVASTLPGTGITMLQSLPCAPVLPICLLSGHSHQLSNRRPAGSGQMFLEARQHHPEGQFNPQALAIPLLGYRSLATEIHSSQVTKKTKTKKNPHTIIIFFLFLKHNRAVLL